MQEDENYTKVHERLKAFRESYPKFLLNTVSLQVNTHALFKCTISNDQGQVVSTGHGYKKIEATSEMTAEDMLSFAETQSVGRALGFFGYVGNNPEDGIATSEDKKASKDAIQKALKVNKAKKIVDASMSVPTPIKNIYEIPEAPRDKGQVAMVHAFLKAKYKLKSNADFFATFPGINQSFTGLSDFCARATKKDIKLWCK